MNDVVPNSPDAQLEMPPETRDARIARLVHALNLVLVELDSLDLPLAAIMIDQAIHSLGGQPVAPPSIALINSAH